MSILSSTSPDPLSTVTPHSTEGAYSILLSHNRATWLGTLFINIFWWLMMCPLVCRLSGVCSYETTLHWITESAAAEKEKACFCWNWHLFSAQRSTIQNWKYKKKSPLLYWGHKKVTVTVRWLQLGQCSGLTRKAAQTCICEYICGFSLWFSL